MISFSFQAPCTSLVATPNASDIYDLDSCVRRFIACMWGDSKDNGSPAGVWKIAISARSTVSSLVCCVHQASPCLAGLTAPSRTRISAIMIACINTTTGSKVSLQGYRELESMSVFGGYKTASLTVTVDVEPFGVAPTQPEGPLPSTSHPESFKSLHPSASRKFIRRSARKKNFVSFCPHILHS